MSHPTPPPGYPVPYAPVAYAPGPPNNALAVVSMVAGLVGLTVLPGVGSVVAVITGHMARGQIARTGESGATLATVGLVTGYVGIGFAAVLVLLLIWSLLAMFGLIAFLPSTGGVLAG